MCMHAKFVASCEMLTAMARVVEKYLLAQANHFTPALSSSFSLSSTPFSNLMRKTVRFGHMSVAMLCELARHSKPAPSQTPSMTPAMKAAQLSWFISFGTEMYWLVSGVLSMIMYSAGLVVDCSRESAGREKRSG